jgi:hypothetical protein
MTPSYPLPLTETERDLVATVMKTLADNGVTAYEAEKVLVYAHQRVSKITSAYASCSKLSAVMSEIGDAFVG